MSGRDEEETATYFGEYPRDFFDFIIIDERHREVKAMMKAQLAACHGAFFACCMGLTATPNVMIT